MDIGNIFVKQYNSYQTGKSFEFYVPVKNEKGETVYFNCNRFGLNAMYLPMPTHNDYVVIAACTMEKQEEWRKINKISNEITRIIEQNPAIVCTSRPEEAESCGKDLTCNVLRTLVNASTLGLYGLANHLASRDGKSFENRCFGFHKSDCLTELSVSIVKSFAVKIKQFFSFAKQSVAAISGVVSSGFNRVFNTLKKWFSNDEVQAAEDHESEMMHLLSQVDPDALKEAAEDPEAFHSKIWNKITDAIMSEFDENLTCEGKEGVPAMENCQKSRVEWKCANCNRRMNTICSITGGFSGSFIASVLTGGSLMVENFGLASRATTLAELGLIKAGAFDSSPVIPQAAIDEMNRKYVTDLILRPNR